MQNELKQIALQIFESSFNFENTALALFRLQALGVPVYKKYLDFLGVIPADVNSVSQIPFLPISLYKYHDVIHTEAYTNNSVTFFSSGTTGMKNSKHIVSDSNLYVKSFSNAFERVYGKPDAYCIISMLPSYLERGNSSLVYMMHHLMRENKHAATGFYEQTNYTLVEILLSLSRAKQPTIIVGVTYALLDLVALLLQSNITLDKCITIIETGGMKGRRKEMIRPEVHQQLKSVFKGDVSSEYGMTEMLSQAYANHNGFFISPPWMKVLIRDANDPKNYKRIGGMGAINVIDLANVYSCAFIETQDIGRLHANNTFEVMGRLDSSELRGCNLMFA
jgi:phenylacetate-coenzyme A ligase PaaK-like adenylate-forming protein